VRLLWLLKKQPAFSYHLAMNRVLLSLLVGLMLSLGGGASASASGGVIWEGTEKPKIALFGKKERRIKITTMGVFIDGKFNRPSALSYAELCRYTMLNFPTNKYLAGVRSKKKSPDWHKAINRKKGAGQQDCEDIRIRATFDFVYQETKFLPNEKEAVKERHPIRGLNDDYLCMIAAGYGRWATNYPEHIKEAKRRGLTCGVDKQSTDEIVASKTLPAVKEKHPIRGLNDDYLCMIAAGYGRWATNYPEHIKEAKRRGLTCGVVGTVTSQTASSSNSQKSNTPTSVELEAERQRRIQLEQQLAALKAQQEQRQRTISSDTQNPLIQITNASSNGPQGTVQGRVTDNMGVAEVRVDGQLVQFDSSGNFKANTYVPDGGKAVTVEAIDSAGLSSSMTVRLGRETNANSNVLVFDSLDPLKRRVSYNNDALALIIGLENYENTDAKAAYADSDAKVFADYAVLKLGIPQARIKTLLNDDADIADVLLSVQDWLSRAIKQGQSDVYVFFAGHGLASEDGEQMYLLPYDGSPRLLQRTALLRDELFSDIAAANPRSVTVFLDTCYSGTTRGTDMLIASRPIAIRAKEQAVPEGFTVMTAAAGDQTAKPLEEAKHGMFSYFLMKGMEGDADANQDNQITAGELHAYVQQNVIQQSSGSQTPELQGDADRVLVRFQ